MISCKEIVDLAFDYLLRELDPKRSRRLEKHLERCPSCINFLRTYARVPALTRDILCSQMPDDLKSSLSEFLKSELCGKRGPGRS